MSLYTGPYVPCRALLPCADADAASALVKAISEALLHGGNDDGVASALAALHAVRGGEVPWPPTPRWLGLPT